MAEILHHLDVWNPINNRKNYQPQLVQDFSHQQYGSWFSPLPGEMIQIDEHILEMDGSTTKSESYSRGLEVEIGGRWL